MAVLEHLEPKGVFRFFEEMCGIPHGSYHTKEISDWCVAFAKERGLEWYQDEADNVILIQPATPGYEEAEPVILQGHLDMVCEKDAACSKDMEKEGLDLAVDGDFVFAHGTTLGGDDGIAVAMALAILDDPSIPHPRLEVILTSDEEVGMLGAAVLDVSPLQGKQLLNLDSEEEGVFTVSCAGGCVSKVLLPVCRETYAGDGMSIRVDGLTGGHSGAEIHKGQANANMLLGRILGAVAEKTDLRLISVEGGLKDNAIPVAAKADLVAADSAAAWVAVTEIAEKLRMEYQVTDPMLTITCGGAEREELAMDTASTKAVLCLLQCMPNGVQTMSHDIPGLVQTSLNLGILKTEADVVSAAFCIRSSVESQKEMIKARIQCLAEQLKAQVEIEGDYPGWEFRRDSALRERMIQVFREQYGRDPKVEAIHAGLECGLLSGKKPDLDCVSIGPNLSEIHTPREKMSISSVQRIWAFVLEVLKRSK